MRAVQELVGHQDLTMTQRYSHLSPAALGRHDSAVGTWRSAASDGDIVETATAVAEVEPLERVKWLGGRDSNPDNGVQSAVSYR